jgi:dTDP-4-dehydrorhamnose 3,5-epimerase
VVPRNVSIEIRATAIPDVKLMVPSRIRDARGFFSETYRRSAFETIGLSPDFVQENHSLSVDRHTVRGLHYQSPPFAQSKLVRVTQGCVFDVAVDLRASSPTYGRHVFAELSAANWHQLFIPVGFAHGFCTLQPNTEVVYLVTNYYSPAHDFGIAWNDPKLDIKWPIEEDNAILSERDRGHPRLSDIQNVFA